MPETRPHPFRVDPYVRTKVWGGRKLPEDYGKDAPHDEPIGETWEVSDLPEGESRVATGPLRGDALSSLVDRWGADLVGDQSPSDAFPLLVKIIDAADDLSVQVHPGEEDVRERFPEADSKDECWLILEAEPGGSILHGLADGVDRDQFRRAVDEGRAANLLRRVDVEPGHVVRIPPGTIHAICEGVTLLEIQEPSDTTFRVYDYDRPGLDGEPRELHLDDAMQVANFGRQPPPELEPEPADFPDATVEVLADAPAFRIERLQLAAPTTWSVDPASPQILFARSARLTVDSPGDDRVDPFELRPGQTAVVPAATSRIRVAPIDESADVVVAGLGGHPLVN